MCHHVSESVRKDPDAGLRHARPSRHVRANRAGESISRRLIHYFYHGWLADHYEHAAWSL